MKGNAMLIETLNSLLSDELTAINQYVVHAEMANNWGYKKLHDSVEKRARQEMMHAEKLIGRILFLEGIPIVSNLKKIYIGADVPKQLANDHIAEETAIIANNNGIKMAGEVSDFATREILEAILNDEDRHIDEIESMLDQLRDMSLPVFLSSKV